MCLHELRDDLAVITVPIKCNERASSLSHLWQAGNMARGWESKAVEFQMDAAEARASQPKAVQASAEQLNAQRERESIELSRTRVLQDLASATNPKYKDLLQRSLQFLDEKLRALSERSSKPDHRA